MVILEEFKKLHEDIKVFKTSVTKDNQERRKNLNLTNKKLIELDSFKNRLDSLKLKPSSDISNIGLVKEIQIYSKGIEIKPSSDISNIGLVKEIQII
ncbi:hypothetical protein QE152_g12773 [Popillia japonica]|uniref:Uncharacterized protein n=1 Tax=Popillia japonica TaxID=7064 RepID=A0AAW1LQI8_POPJA